VLLARRATERVVAQQGAVMMLFIRVVGAGAVSTITPDEIALFGG
jgi:hypothetical protein